MMWMTADGGFNWRPRAIPIRATNLAVLPSAMAALGSPSGCNSGGQVLGVSPDQGATWDLKMLPQDFVCNRVVAGAKDTFWAECFEGGQAEKFRSILLISDDAGRSWGGIRLPEHADGPPAAANDDEAWLVGDPGNGMWHTVNRGSSWIETWPSIP